MIRYEFVCNSCGTEFESPTRVDVSHCGVLAKRKYSIGGIAFRGNGFYSKDK